MGVLVFVWRGWWVAYVCVRVCVITYVCLCSLRSTRPKSTSHCSNKPLVFAITVVKGWPGIGYHAHPCWYIYKYIDMLPPFQTLPRHPITSPCYRLDIAFDTVTTFRYGSIIVCTFLSKGILPFTVSFLNAFWHGTWENNDDEPYSEKWLSLFIHDRLSEIIQNIHRGLSKFACLNVCVVMCLWTWVFFVFFSIYMLGSADNLSVTYILWGCWWGQRFRPLILFHRWYLSLCFCSI